MNRDQALKLVKQQITEQRYQHTLGVEESAIWLAEKYGADKKQAQLAAIFHDYAKFRPKEEMKSIIISEGMPQDLLVYNMELWHAPVGAYLVETEAGIKDSEVLNAIRYHTSGRENMTLLEKIIYLADYIEPGRNFPGVDEVRKTASEQLDQAVLEAMRNTILFLMKRGQSIYPDSFKAYNHLIMNKEESA
ncbi:bis(5'-nucleosyl)-tetraphosphatase (symmetrical) YqeK [Peribacillus deserti]|uniref:bis(5'-nucleosyl)-tetraphosphatase (symmetrical) n=1 Tax=Peribacillus deserti TaxID=673318 RepID=A0A2N5M999_9BACI|nr:bis(5'-nucleosyl)-tetraphosphatase (symmetrical) YqeK [Peribacillus deserti]PLT30936.1 phosphohydrolase [Peribacillus deserti]